jgi:hypothetical protein
LYALGCAFLPLASRPSGRSSGEQGTHADSGQLQSTILSFVAAFAALGLGSGHAGAAASALLVAGVFCGSAAWWAGLSTGVALLRTRLTTGRLALVDRAAGAILALFGLDAVFTAIRSMRVT